jgi:hypothetical protein
MNNLAREFYRADGKIEPVFQGTLLLSEKEIGFDEACKMCPDLPRGWFELCRLSLDDRIEFVRDFWLNFLPYHPSFHLFLWDFFQKLDDIDIVLVQAAQNAPWSSEMVYSLKDNRSFFRGLAPAKESDVDELKNAISIPLPRDYLSFLRIHNGFGKLSEIGLLRVDQVVDAKQRLMDQFLWAEKPLRVGNQDIDPGALIPFYESFGLGSYQCFFNDWFPVSEMGNVFLSGIDYTISDYTDRKGWADQMAFPTFLDWLSFFLEGNSLD